MVSSFEIKKEQILRLIESEAEVNLRVFAMMVDAAAHVDSVFDLIDQAGDDIIRLELIRLRTLRASKWDIKGSKHQLNELPGIIAQKMQEVKSKWS